MNGKNHQNREHPRTIIPRTQKIKEKIQNLDLGRISMDSQRPPFNLRIIELPINLDGVFKNETSYHDFLFENPETIEKGLIPITKEFPIPNAGRVDLLFIKDNIIYLTEVKIAHNETIIKKAISQTSRYVNGMNFFLPLLKETTEIRGLLILCGWDIKQRKEYDVTRTPLELLPHENNLYDKWKTKLIPLIKHFDTLKQDITTLTRQKEKLKRTIKKLDAKREKIYHNIDVTRNTPLNVLMDTVIAKGQLVQAFVSGKKIMKVDNILNDANVRYLVESSTGFYNDEEELNKGKKAYFYFSPRIAPSAYAKIQKIAKIRHYADSVKDQDT